MVRGQYLVVSDLSVADFSDSDDSTVDGASNAVSELDVQLWDGIDYNTSKFCSMERGTVITSCQCFLKILLA